MTEFYKCVDCWRVYDTFQLTKGPMDTCGCGSRRFKNTFPTKLTAIKRFLTDPKYIIFGERVYDKQTS